MKKEQCGASFEDTKDSDEGNDRRTPARQHNTTRGQQNQLEGDEGTPKLHGKVSRGLGKDLHRRAEIFEKFRDCWDEYVSLAEAAIFEYAFRLGARLTMEVKADEE